MTVLDKAFAGRLSPSALINRIIEENYDNNNNNDGRGRQVERSRRFVPLFRQRRLPVSVFNDVEYNDVKDNVLYEKGLECYEEEGDVTF